jgi:putative hydrolase of the HAD superfamily
LIGKTLNIIFDLGGVVITWDPDEFVAEVFDEDDVRKTAKKHILDHGDWIELDRGTLTREEAIIRGTNRSGLPESQVRRLMQAVPSFLSPISESLNLVHELKEHNNKLFVLSNLHPDSINYLEEAYSFLDLFDGKVISCRIHKVKPESEMFYHLIDSFQLDINDSVFIDDMDINCQAANNLGIKAIKFENPEQCRNELRAMGCLS